MTKLNFEIVTIKDASLFNKQNPASIKVTERGFYLTLTACNRYDISAGQFMHLHKVRGDKGIVVEWYLTFDEQEENGYKVCRANHGAAVVLSRSLARLFKNAIACKYKDSFYLEDTRHELKGNQIIKINTNQTVKQH